jgi:hypothetical protein
MLKALWYCKFIIAYVLQILSQIILKGISAKVHFKNIFNFSPISLSIKLIIL